MAERFADDFKRFFLRGLSAMLPPLLTLMIIVFVLKFVDQNIGKYVDRFVQWTSVQVICISRGQFLTVRGAAVDWTDVIRGPDAIWAEVKSFWQIWHLHWLSFLLAFVLIYVFGRFVASLMGRAMWRAIERAFFRLPVMKQIYPSVKQVTDFLLAERKMEFSRVVAVEYPRKGVWSVGLVTSEGMRTLRDALGEDLVTVFIPSSPTPVTGYTITLRRDEIVDLPLSIDDALRFTVSGGVIMPPSQVLTEAEVKQTIRGLFPPQAKKKEITA